MTTNEVMTEAIKENFVKGKKVSIHDLIDDYTFIFTQEECLRNIELIHDTYYRENTGYIVDGNIYDEYKDNEKDMDRIRKILYNYIGDESEIQFVFINKANDYDYYDINMHVGTLKGSYIFHLYNHFGLNACSSNYWPEISWLNWKEYVNKEPQNKESTI